MARLWSCAGQISDLCLFIAANSRIRSQDRQLFSCTLHYQPMLVPSRLGLRVPRRRLAAYTLLGRETHTCGVAIWAIVANAWLTLIG